MRLGTCIALEVAMAVGAAAGAWIGVGRAIDLAGTYFAAHEAVAAPSVALAPPPAPLPAAKLRVAAPPLPRTVFDTPDEILLAPLAAAPVTRVKLNYGGTSLSFRIDFANGARAAFKPEQTWPQSDPRKEIAAYRVDRLLGIGHVAPAKAVSFEVEDLIAAVDEPMRAAVAKRVQLEGIARDGVIRGELQWWIPEIRDAKIGRWRVDEDEGMDLWTSYLQVGVPIPADVRPLVAQLATVVLFDVLIDNADRWTGYNTKASPDGHVLYFMDNTLSFSQFSLGHATNLKPMYRIQVFPRTLVERMRALTAASIAAAVEDGGDLAPLLTPAEIHAIIARRDHLIGYIDGLIEQFGENAVLALP